MLEVFLLHLLVSFCPALTGLVVTGLVVTNALLPAPNLISPDETGESDIAMPDTDALVSTVGALALADHSDDTGTLFEVSGRRVVKLRWQRSMGAALQTGNTFTPAALLDRFEDIIDMSKPEHPSGPVDTAKALSRRLLKLGRTTDDGRIGFKDQVVVVTGAGGGYVSSSIHRGRRSGELTAHAPRIG